MRWLVRAIHHRLGSLVITVLFIASLLYALLALRPTPNVAQQSIIPQDTSAPQTPAQLAAGDAAWSGAFDAPFVRGYISALAMRGDDLYVGGKFNQLGNQNIINVGKWNGESWAPLGNGFMGALTNDEVHAIAVAGSKVFVAGNFTGMGNTVVNNIVMWDETTQVWSTLEQGVLSDSESEAMSEVHALAVSGDVLYVGGTFSHAGGKRVNNIALWSITGSRWYSMKGGTDDTVLAMVTLNDALYVGGRFREAGGEPTLRLAQWDKKQYIWLSLPDAQVGEPHTTSVVNVLALRETELYVGGRFGSVNGRAAGNFASWNTTTGVWTTYGIVGDSFGAFVNAIAFSGDGKQVYVGGFFSNADTVNVRNIARLEGKTWNPVNSAPNQGTNDTIRALHPNPFDVEDIYVAGSFSYVNGDKDSPAGIYSPAIALVHDRQWSPFGQGISCVPSDSCLPLVNAMTGNSEYLYVSGVFNRAGGVKVQNIARFNGRRWEALNSGNMQMDSLSVMALSGSDLYVAGTFKINGNPVFNNIAKYSTTTGQWSGLGAGQTNGVNGTVQSLAVSEGKLYVGGAFSQAGGQESYYVAVWDGASWKPLTNFPFNGLSSPVGAMAADGSGGVYMVTSYCASNDSGATLVGCGFLRFAGGQWQGLKYGVVPTFFAAPPAIGGGRTYFGGSFMELVSLGNTQPTIPVNNIAGYDGSSWTPLGSPPNDGVLGQRIYALAYHGDSLYAGGCFEKAGNLAIKNIASWGGSQWASLGSGVDSCITALHSQSDGLYVGGSFTQTGIRYASVINIWKRNVMRNSFGPTNGLDSTTPDNFLKIEILPHIVTSRTISSRTVTLAAHAATTDTLFLEVGEVNEPPLPLPSPHSPLRVYQVALTDADGIPVAEYDPPFSITLRYSDEELVAWNLDEESLNILWLDSAGNWQPLLPCAGCTPLLEQNELVILHDQFSYFALAGEIIEPIAEPIVGQSIYMPLIDE